MIMASDLWPGLDLRHLSAFEAVHKTGSFARAAEILGYTQPAVSQQIAALERIVGARLFERTSGRSTVTLSQAGQVFLNHVEAVGARLATARADLEDLRRGETGTLRIGGFQSASAQLLPRIVQRLRAERPTIQIELVERMLDTDLLDLVQYGSLDFAFAMLPVDDHEFNVVPLVEDEFCLVAPEAGPFPTAIEALRELKDVPMLSYRTCRSASILTNGLRAGGIEPNYVFHSDDNSALKELVRAGVGVAIMPRLWTSMGGNEGLAISSLGSLLPARTVALAWNKNRLLASAQAAFLEMARSVYRAPTAPRALVAVSI